MAKNMIYVTGDLHGGEDMSMKYLNSKNWIEQKNLTKNDTLIQLGDFGFIWNTKSNKNYKSDLYWQEWFAAKRYTTLIIPGNHDNWDIIDNLPITTKWNGLVRELKTAKGILYLAITGEIYTIDGLNILTVCGAESIDKEYRTIGVDWWKQEKITEKEVNYTLNNLELFYSKGVKLDYILSHTMPSKYIDKFIHRTIHTEGKFRCKTADFLNVIWEKYKPNIGLHCGHFHMNWYEKVDDRIIQVHYKKEPFRIK